MDARRSRAVAARTRPAGRPHRLEAGRRRWRTLTAQLSRCAVAQRVIDSESRQPAGAERAVGTAMRSLAITRTPYGHGLHLLVSGQLDALTAHQLEQACARVGPKAADTVVLDLGEVTSLDASGLAVLFAASERLGERLVIIISPSCAHTIHIAKVHDRLPIIEG
jgi:anti-anti-sigma factor